MLCDCADFGILSSFLSPCSFNPWPAPGPWGPDLCCRALGVRAWYSKSCLELSHTPLGKNTIQQGLAVPSSAKTERSSHGKPPPRQLQATHPDGEPCWRRIQTAHSQLCFGKRLQGKECLSSSLHVSSESYLSKVLAFHRGSCSLTQKAAPMWGSHSNPSTREGGTIRVQVYYYRLFRRGRNCPLVCSPWPSCRACYLGTQTHRNCGNWYHRRVIFLIELLSLF